MSCEMECDVICGVKLGARIIVSGVEKGVMFSTKVRHELLCETLNSVVKSGDVKRGVT